MSRPTTSGWGGQSCVAPLRRVLVKSPVASHGSQARIDAEWEALHYPARPRWEAVVRQHASFIELLEASGAELAWISESPDTGLDSIFTHDPALVTDAGAVLCRMGKPARSHEPLRMAEWFETHGIPVLGAIESPGTLEAGDVVWLDPRTLAVGEGYRTNAEGIAQLRRLLGEGVDRIIPVPLPHWTGPADCLHLMSLVSPVDDDLCVVSSRLLAVPFRQFLLDRGVTLVEVPDEEYDSFGCNVLAVAPRRVIMLDGNPVTRRRLEATGCAVQVFEGRDLCLLGGGGPTCLTRPVLRRET